MNDNLRDYLFSTNNKTIVIYLMQLTFLSKVPIIPFHFPSDFSNQLGEMTMKGLAVFIAIARPKETGPMRAA